MPKIYFCGLTSSNLPRREKSNDNATLSAIREPSEISCENMTDIEIGWDYLLVWKKHKLYLSKNFSSDRRNDSLRLLEIPDHPDLTFKQAIAGSDSITILSSGHDLWLHSIHNSNWKKVADFVTSEGEHVVKAAQGRCTVALTNSGHVFNIPVMLNNNDNAELEFVDVACGFDHTVLLAKTADVYSIGMGTRGQLGHGDLEDCDEPKLIEALAGLKVAQIAASGWHSAVITDQGDLYTWGWNNQGQLGLADVENVAAVPTLVDFKNEAGETVEINVKKVQCGNVFTICRTETGEFWGCGSNKYGQLGLPNKDTSSIRQLIPIKFDSIKEPILDFKCREWATCIYTNK